MTWTRDDIITSDGYLSAFPQNYHKADVFYQATPIVWRGKVHGVPSPSASLIVSGHSDAPIVDAIARRYPRAVWFAINKQTSGVHGIPLGITNNTQESALHPIYGNTDIMVDVASHPRTVENLVYMNFSSHTYPYERTRVWTMFHAMPWVTCEQPDDSIAGRRRFLRGLRNHSFVLCPRGNGVDTHRVWETLYMGSIPIVIRDIAHSDWMDLPILFVDSWNDVTETYLLNARDRIESAEWNMKKLLIGYWIDLINKTSS